MAPKRIFTYLYYNIGRWTLLLGLFLGSIIIVAPIAWTFSTSLRTPYDSFGIPPKWLPTDFAYQNYVNIFNKTPFFRAFGNSVFVTTCTVIGQLTTAAMAGYAFARLKFPGSSVIFGLVLATLMMPFHATIVPVYMLISYIGLSDTLWSLVLPSIPTAFGTFLLRQYFLQIPVEYEEAAVLDGASQWYVFLRIYLPLARPGLFILAILSFNSTWNEFFRPLIFIRSNSLYTIPLSLNQLRGIQGTGSMSGVLAGVVLSMLPVIVIYSFGQRYFIEGINVGGVKG